MSEKAPEVDIEKEEPDIRRCFEPSSMAIRSSSTSVPCFRSRTGMASSVVKELIPMVIS
jgi:hypothetical protein